jgi:crossover junction endodeoxyribonuclease RuvC
MAKLAKPIISFKKTPISLLLFNVNCVALIKDKIILGIDPGTIVMGYGLIHVIDNQIKPLSIGVIKLEKLEDHALRLKKIFERTVGIIEEYKPDELAIEAPFFGKNVQSMLKLGRAQGVAIAAALSKNIPITEYSPKKIKMSITGNGNASKEQVAAMLKQMLGIDTEKEYLDATDALGAAVCHHFQNKNGSSGAKKSYGSWKAFVNDNPKRKV